MISIQLSAEKQIHSNIIAHDKIVHLYEKMHKEIFNDAEQTRLYAALEKASHLATSGNGQLKALDYGCGSGNLSAHLLKLNLNVVAADVSGDFLKLVQHRHQTNRLSTLLLNGNDLSNIPSNEFDLVATYSVLHHIPDYLGAIQEMARVCKPGGVLYFDHENNDEYWSGKPDYKLFRKKAMRFNWMKFLSFSNYVHKVKRIFNPRYTNEGDIHVWQDDHIDWKKITENLLLMNFEVVFQHDYLLSNKLYRTEVYNEYKNQLTDTRVMAFRKKAN